MNRFPDFIIIGAMKCATSSIHEQLSRQENVLMSSPKEPNWFSDDDVFDRGVDWYSSCFLPKSSDQESGKLWGESSTHYTKLPTYPKTVDRMQEYLPPTTRFVYIMRHPIDRLISQYIHEWTKRVIDLPLDQAIDNHPELVAYSRYSYQIEPFLDAFGHERILPVFYERFKAEPELVFDRICQFVGVVSQVDWESQSDPQNRSSERLRDCAWRDRLLETPILKQLRRSIVPRSWRNRIKGFWQMRTRPSLSAAKESELTGIFDSDLESFRDWFGIDITCSTFKEVGSSTDLEWSDRISDKRNASTKGSPKCPS